MSKFIQQFAHPSRAVRFVGRRRGSVLILCVVLIVVLALIGTAMLAGTRIDRFTSQQHSYNTQIDLLVEGAKQVAKSELVADLYDRTVTPPVYRPLVEQSVTGAGSFDGQKLFDNFDGYYIRWTGAGTPNFAVDTWLASLLPQRGTTTSTVYWPAITAPLASVGFEAPDRPLGAGSITISGGSLTLRNHLVPASKTIAYSDGTQQTFPALREMDVAAGQPIGTPYLAADADGDGIADSLLCRLLPGELNGVTWYVAMRIVDNAAKVNVNTALSKQYDFDGTPPFGMPLPPSRFTRYYTSAIGLMEMLQSYPTGVVTDSNATGTEMSAVLADRSNKAYPHGMMRGDPAQPPPLGQEALDNTGAGRTDFAYPSLGAALYYGMGMRLLNPGYARSGNEKWIPYDIGDMTTLLGGFTLLKPGASGSKLEQALQQSLLDSAPNGSTGARNGMAHYNPNQWNIWFGDSFYADSEQVPPPGVATATPYKSLRAILATNNPVSNYALAHDLNAPFPYGVLAANRCAFTDQHLAVNASKMPDYPTSGTGTATTSLTVAKTDVNTAKFGELWRAYWNVMVDHDQMPNPVERVGTPFRQPGGMGNYQNWTYAGNHFDAAENPITNQNLGGGGEEHPQQMFRSSIRDFRQPALGAQVFYLAPAQQLQLRAAIAAVNTEDLRDANSDVTRRDIQLEVTSTGTTSSSINALVSVYGIERQPFITEVFVDTDDWNATAAGPTNKKGYIAIELYNPYPEPINITGWAFAVIDRRDPNDTPPPNPYPNLGQLGKQGLSYFYLHNGLPSTTPGGPITPPWTVPNTGVATVIPPNGYLVLENYPGPSGAPADPEAAADRTPGVVAGGAATLYVPNLHWVVRDANDVNAPSYNESATTHLERRGGELVILQPLVAGGNVSLTDPDTIPVDSFDFTGLLSAEYYANPGPGGGIRAATRWQYVRGNNTGTGPNWKFVYPGRYAGDSNTGGGRHQGTSDEQWFFPGTAPAATANVGAGEATGSYVTTHTIQLGADGMPGTHQVRPGVTASAPYGGFARNVDILQVPYIGSYRISFVNDPASVLELNSISMDSCFANDCDAGTTAMSNDERTGDTETSSREQVGRFALLRDRTPANHYDDFDPTGDFNADSTAAGTNKWRYRWAIDLFDYLTVNSPGNDYLPNVPLSEPAYTPPGVPVPARQPVDNDGDGKVGDVETLTPTATDGPGLEDHLPYQGLININTAPWRVLGAVPWLKTGDEWAYNPAAADGARWTYTPGATAADGEEDNISLAKAIVRWRDGEPARPPQAPYPALLAVAPNGPFSSLFELYRVPDFVEVQQKLIAGLTTAGPDDADGDFSPYNATSAAPNPDTVRHDFEEQFLLLNRVSNLITTHSDSYTVYILVQGWQDAGSATPRLVAQRRVAFIQDRSSVRPDNTALPPPVNVPND